MKRLIVIVVIASSISVVMGFSVWADDQAATLVLEWTATGSDQGADFGNAAAAAGDVNGDNYGDVIVGAPKHSDGLANNGAAFVYHGTAQGLIEGPADWSDGGEQQGSGFGWAAGGAGDFNGDGYDDVIVGAYRYNKTAEEVEAGAVYIYYGSLIGLSASPDWSVVGPHKNANFGYAVGGAGDLNGDGVDDVVVGAPHYTNGETNEGAIFVYYGSDTDTPSSTAAWSYESDQGGAILGTAVSGAGDVNGDEVNDLIAGMSGYDGEETDVGAAILFFGSESGLAASPDWTAEGEQAGSHFGEAVGGAGDVNHDGWDEIVVGAPVWDRSEEEPGVGKAYLYYGSASGPGTTAGWSDSLGTSYAQFGRSVGGGGDVNNDHYDDLVVGAPGWERDHQKEGAVFVYLGSAGGLGINPVWRGEGDKADAGLGHAAGMAGDVNDDGLDDIVAGAPKYKVLTNPYGRAVVYHSAEGIEYEHRVYLPLVVGL